MVNHNYILLNLLNYTSILWQNYQTYLIKIRIYAYKYIWYNCKIAMVANMYQNLSQRDLIFKYLNFFQETPIFLREERFFIIVMFMLFSFPPFICENARPNLSGINSLYHITRERGGGKANWQAGAHKRIVSTDDACWMRSNGPGASCCIFHLKNPFSRFSAAIRGARSCKSNARCPPVNLRVNTHHRDNLRSRRVHSLVLLTLLRDLFVLFFPRLFFVSFGRDGFSDRAEAVDLGVPEGEAPSRRLVILYRSLCYKNIDTLIICDVRERTESFSFWKSYILLIAIGVVTFGIVLYVWEYILYFFFKLYFFLIIFYFYILDYYIFFFFKIKEFLGICIFSGHLLGKHQKSVKTFLIV